MNLLTATAALFLALVSLSDARAQSEEPPTHAECAAYSGSSYDDCRSGRIRDRARAAEAARAAVAESKAEFARQMEAREKAEFNELGITLKRMSSQDAFLLAGKMERENKITRAVQIYEHLVDRPKAGEWAVRANERLLKLSGR